MTALLAAEWIKARSVRSTAWTVALTLLISVGLAYVFGAGFRANFAEMAPDQQAAFDPILATFYSVTLGQLALVALAVFLMTGEYSTGTIRGSLAAVPRRARYFAAKAGTAALLAAAVAVVTVGGTFAAAQVGLGRYGTSLAADGVLEAAVGACLYLVLIHLFALGLAALLRSAVVTLSILLPLLFLGAQGLGVVPGIREFGQFLPDQAGMMIMHIVPPPDPGFTRAYGPWGGLGIMALWAVVALLAGYAAVRRRDT
jgi:ABC-2 type transport system permease protein